MSIMICPLFCVIPKKYYLCRNLVVGNELSSPQDVILLKAFIFALVLGFVETSQLSITIKDKATIDAC